MVGPTASGKSAHAHRWAKESNGDIVNADSLQVYRSLNIGTAKPTAAEMAEVPHHLFNLAGAGDTFNAGDFRRAALDCLEKLQRDRDRGPIFIVGGSGFYIQALLHGMFEAPSASAQIQERLRLRMNSEGPEILHHELSQHDPVAGDKIHVNDRYRIQRALEIWESTGRRPSEIRKQFQEVTFPYPTLRWGVECARESLVQRISERTQQMLAAGWLAEVEALREQGLKNWPPLQSVGYKEVQEVLDRRIALEQLEPRIVTHTMQLAKRQMTWFRRDTKIVWVPTTSNLSWMQAFAMLGSSYEPTS